MHGGTYMLGGDQESWDRVRARAGIYLEKLTDDFKERIEINIG